MADAETIKEFVVNFVYKSDEASQRRAQQGLQGTMQTTEQMQVAVANLQKALNDLGKAFGSMAGPATQLQAHNKAITDSWERVRKGAVEFGRVSTLAVAGFLAQMRDVAKQYQEIGFIAQRTGASIQSLKALEQASRGLGVSAGQTAAAIAHMQELFQTQPGTEQQFLGQAGKYFEIARKEAHLTTEEWNKLDKATQQYLASRAFLADPSVPDHAKKMWGEKWWGTQYAETRKAIDNNKEYFASFKENIKAAEAMGETEAKHQQRVKDATAAQQAWTNLVEHFNTVWSQAFGDIAPLLTSVLKGLDEVVKVVAKINNMFPFAAVIEGLGIAGGASWALWRAFKALGGVFGGAGKEGSAFKKILDGVKGGLDETCKQDCGTLSKGLEDAAKKTKSLSDNAKDLGLNMRAISAAGLMISVVEKGVEDRRKLAKQLGETDPFSERTSAHLKQQREEQVRAAVPGLGKLVDAINAPRAALGLETGQQRVEREVREADKAAAAPTAAQPAPAAATPAATTTQTSAAQAAAAAAPVAAAAAAQAVATAHPATPAAPEAPRRSWLSELWSGDPLKRAGVNLPGPKVGYQQGGIVRANLHPGEMVLPKPISEGLQRLYKGGGGQQAPHMDQSRMINMITSGLRPVLNELLQHSPILGQIAFLQSAIPVLKRGMERYERLGPDEVRRQSEAQFRASPAGRALDPAYQQIARGHEALAGPEGAVGRNLSDWVRGVAHAPKVIIDNVDDFARELIRGAARRGRPEPTGEPTGVPGAPGAPGAVPGAPGAPGAAAGAPTTLGGRVGAAVGRAVGGAEAAISRFVGGQTFEQMAPQVTAKLQQDLGLTKEQAAGIVGNLGVESGGFRQMEEVGGGGGLGWAQWTGTRRKDFERFAAERNLDVKSPEANYQFLVHEMQQPEHRQYLQALRGAKSVEEATSVTQSMYERPAAATAHPERRLAMAQQAFRAPAPEQIVAGPITPGFPGAGAQPGEIARAPGAQRVPPQVAEGGRLPFQTTGGGKVLTDRPPAGVNPDLFESTRAGMEASLPEGYTARVTSGVRSGDPRSQHFGGKALDWQIYDEKGNKVPNRGAENSGLYRQAYVHGLAHMMTNKPELADQMAWGGHFGTKIGGGGVEDTMHYDLAGPRGGMLGGEKAISAEHREAAQIAQQMQGAQVMTAQRGGIIPNLPALGGMMPLIAHAGEMVLPQALSQGLQRLIGGGGGPGMMGMMERMMLGGGMGTTNIGGSRNVTINQHNTHQFGSGGGDQQAVLQRFRDVHERLTGDLVRNFRAAIV